MTRHFLDWNAPVTQQVSGFLLPGEIGTIVDLSHTVTVVPTRQAGRRLSETLVRECAGHDAALLSSRVVTPSYFLLPEVPNLLEAGGMTVKLAWASVLEEADPGAYPGMFPPGLPHDDPEWAAQTGDLIHRLRQTLADGALRIGDVIQKCGNELPEPERWSDLARLEQAYLAQLEKIGRHDPIFNRIEHAGSLALPDAVKRIVLAAVPDPSELLIKALTRLDSRVDLHILVHAPEALAERFDAWGRPLPEAWSDAEIDIPDPDSNLFLAGSPADQSLKVIELLLAGNHEIGDSAIGVPDDAVTRFLESDLEKRGISVFDPSDHQLRDHSVYGVLDAYAALIIEKTYRDFSRLLRHPDILTRIIAEPGPDSETPLCTWQLLKELDTFQNECLPIDFDDVVRALTGRRAERFPQLETAVRFLQMHLEAFDASDAEPGLRDFLRDIYTARTIRSDRTADAEFETVASKCDAALRELAEASVHAGRDKYLPLRLFLQRLGEETYHRTRRESIIDLEGWVELPWNDANHMIITGMNEGVVPDGRVSDVFLPDSLRQRLALHDDGRRMARDAYIMSSCIHSRQASGRVIFIAGKTSSAGDPLKPSRLLFRCPDEQLPDRAARLFGSAASARPNTPATIAFTLDATLPHDVPASAAQISSVSVTAFSDYLTCPFRFYLKRVLGMTSLHDEKPGLDQLDFGNMIHDALRQMVTTDMWRCEQEEELAAFLAERADRWVLARFEGARSLPIRIALESARQRLAAAARVQVELVRQGWEIEASEMDVRTSIGPIDIVGKVDRMDRHRDTGCLRIIDYKTSDNDKDPEKTHLATSHAGTAAYAVTNVGSKVKRWTDLQLPLYRYLVCGEDAPSTPVTLAYFNMPKAVGDTGVREWRTFTDSLFDSALSCAKSIVDEIQAQHFWPPVESVTHDDFKSLFFAEVPDCITEP